MSGAVAIHAHAWRKALTIDDAQRGGCDAASSAEASARGAARRAAPATRRRADKVARNKQTQNASKINLAANRGLLTSWHCWLRCARMPPTPARQQASWANARVRYLFCYA